MEGRLAYFPFLESTDPLKSYCPPDLFPKLYQGGFKLFLVFIVFIFNGT